MKSIKELVLDLQDAGITNDYCNILLKAIKEEKENSFNAGVQVTEKEAYAVGKAVGREEARVCLLRKCETSDNFNTQHLRDWAIKADLKTL